MQREQDRYSLVQKRARISVFAIVGILVLVLGTLVGRFGVDADPGWGRRRIALVFLGALIILVPWITRRGRSASALATNSDLFILPVLLAVIAAYFWFITLSYDTTSNYYALLATSFRNRELSLPLKPDPALLQLPNPYDPAARQGLKVPQDLSLYNGKFYLYWGPAPSLLLLIARPILPGRLGEVDLLLLFMCGIFLAEYLLLFHLWERFFPHIPRWMLLLSILVAGFANPALWLLSQPKIYEAAIAGAQFFFIAGLTAAILALDRQPASRWGLAMAGILWALAVGTRSVAVFPVLFMTFMVAHRFFRVHRHSFVRFLVELLPLALPLFAGALGFVWYNWARFGSPLETGFSYQLAAPHLQKHMNELFLPGYIFQNFYNYLLNPFAIRTAFPFLSPIRGQLEALLPGQTLPDLYTAQAITGILWAVPFLVFAVVPVLRLVKGLISKNPSPEMHGSLQELSLNWIVTSLLGSFLLPFLSLLAFFWAAMRYAEDFMPALVLLSLIGFWQAYQARSDSLRLGKIYATVGVMLAGISMSNAFLLALSALYNNGLLGK